MPILAIWFAYRIFTSLWAALMSATRPGTQLEQIIPLWPPYSNLGVWLERVFLLPWQRWDVEWYLKIVTNGYQKNDGTAAFHPLYALLALPLARAGILPLLSLMLVSSAAALLFLFVFERLARLDQDPKTARIAVCLMVGFPLGFILFAPYTESLFLLCSASCLYLIRRKKWILSGVMGGLATLTRQQGIFLILPIAWELWEASGRDIKLAIKNWQSWLPAAGPVLGLAFWLFYRAIYLSDFPVNPWDIKSLVYAGLISPSTVKVVQVFQFTWPWHALWLAVGHLKSPDVDILIDLFLGAAFLALLVASWPRLRTSYRIYSAVVTLIGFSDYTGPVHPYMGLPRHLFLAIPVFIGLAPVITEKKRWLIYLFIYMGGGLLGMLFLIKAYVLNGWVP